MIDGVGRRAADLALFQLLDQRGLGVAGRRLGGVAVGGDLLGAQRVALGDLRQPALAVVQLGVGVVGALDVRLEEAVEGDDLAGRAELGVPAVGGAAADLDGDRLADGVLHLGGDGPLPDQLVQPELVAGQAGLGRGAEAVARGADRLVRLLRVLDLAGVGARLVRQVVGAVQLRDLRAGRGDRGVGQRRGVRTHVGDEAVLVQLLRDLHGGLGAEAELARRPPAGGWWCGRARTASGGTAWTRRSAPRSRCSASAAASARAAASSRCSTGVALELAVGAEVAALRDPPAVDGGQPGGERARGRRRRRPGRWRRCRSGPSTRRSGTRSARAPARRPAGSRRTAHGPPTAAA